MPAMRSPIFAGARSCRGLRAARPEVSRRRPRMKPNAQALEAAKPQCRSPVEGIVEHFDGVEPLDECGGGIAKHVQLVKQSIAQLRHLGEINVFNIHDGHGFLAALTGRRVRSAVSLRAPLAR